MSVSKTGLIAALIVLAGCPFESVDSSVSSKSRSSSAHGRGHGRTPTPVVFDTDMDFDDAAALAYLCQEHKLGQIDLRAVTVSNNGVGLPGSAIRHARCVLAECGLDIPVADGSNTVLHSSPDLQFAVESVLAGAFAECEESRESSEISAPELFAEAVRTAPARVVVIGTGPLSNIATALEQYPLRRSISQMFIMGGALSVGGNLFGESALQFDNSQEFNIWADPASAQVVFETIRPYSGKLVPLDATNDVPVTAAFVQQLANDQQTPEAAMVLRILQQPITQYGISLGLFYWWDPLTAVAAVRDISTVDFERDRVGVLLEGPGEGRTYSTPDGARMHVGTSSDAARFEQILLDVLNGR